MPKIFALRSRLLEVQNSLLCNPSLAHDGHAGKGVDGVGPCHALDEAQVGQQPTWACGTAAWDEDWGSSLLVGDHAAAASNSDIIEVPEPEVVAEGEEKGEGEDDTGKILDSWLRNTTITC